MDITTLSPGEQENYIEHLRERIRQQQQKIEQFHKRKRVDDTEDQDISQSTKRFKSFEYSNDFKQNLQKLQTQALPPSSALWDLLVVGNVIEEFEDFQLRVAEKRIEISNIELDQIKCIDGDKFDFIQQKITDLVRRDNEGYSMLMCGNCLIHIVDELQRIKKGSKKRIPAYHF